METLHVSMNMTSIRVAEQVRTVLNVTSVSVAEQVSTVLLSLCCLLGIPGNIYVVVLIIRHFNKNNFTLHLMLNLAASDLLCLTSLLGFIYNMNFEWTLGSVLCKLLFFLVLTSTYAGLLTVTLMSVQRYLMVLHRTQWAKLGKTGERILLFCLWTLACVLSCPGASNAHLLEGEHSCTRTTPDQKNIAIIACEILLGFVLPFSIIASSYYRLYKEVNQTALFSSQRLTRLVTTIVVTFVILWIPIHVINLVEIIAIAMISTNLSVSNQIMRFWDSGHIVVKSFTFLNSCVNPLLYVCSSKQLFQSPERSPKSSQI